MNRRRAIFELFFAGALWGFGFVATKWTLLGFQPVESLFYRFLIAVVAGELLHLAVYRRLETLNVVDMRKAFPAGAILALFIIPQTVGLQFTTATNSGFLTTLYIIFVPLLNQIFFGVRTQKKIFMTALLACFGAFLLMGGRFSQFNKGDLMTSLCAFIGALHIIYLGRTSPSVSNVIRFNNWQSLFCMIFVLPFIFLPTDRPSPPLTEVPFLAWMGLIYLGVFSSAIAFLLQVRAQRVLSDTTASMLFLLESPFAMLFGFFLLGDRLIGFQGLGAGLILLSSALTILWDSPAHSKSKTE